jgi:hypothetical protein
LDLASVGSVGGYSKYESGSGAKRKRKYRNSPPIKRNAGFKDWMDASSRAGRTFEMVNEEKKIQLQMFKIFAHKNLSLDSDKLKHMCNLDI